MYVNKIKKSRIDLYTVYAVFGQYGAIIKKGIRLIVKTDSKRLALL